MWGDEVNSEFVSFGGPGLAFAAIVLALFWKADEAIADDARLAISKQLQSLRVYDTQISWPYAFITMFDSIFGNRHWSLFCFFRSALISILLLSFLSLLCFCFGDHNTKFEIYVYIFLILFAGFIIAIPMNVIGDYFSLLATRFIVNVLIKSRKITTLFFILVADFVITTIWVFAAGTVTVAVILLVLSQLDISARYDLDVFGVLNRMILETHRGKNDVVRFAGYERDPAAWLLIFSIITTYLTSFWLWVTAIGWIFVRFGSRIQQGVGFLQWLLPINTKPLRSIGIFASAFTFFAINFLWVLGDECFLAEC